MFGQFSTIDTSVKTDDGTDSSWHLLANNPLNLFLNCSISVLTIFGALAGITESPSTVSVLNRGVGS